MVKKRISAGPGLPVFILSGSTYFSVFRTGGRAAPWPHLPQAESLSRLLAGLGTGHPLPSLLPGRTYVDMVPIVPSVLKIKILSAF